MEKGWKPAPDRDPSSEGSAFLPLLPGPEKAGLGILDLLIIKENIFTSDKRYAEKTNHVPD